MTTPGPRPDLTADCARLLPMLRVWSWRQWHRDGQRCDVDVYLEAGMDALAACLARYDPAQGAAFATYASRRIAGAIQDALRSYQVWRDIRRIPGGNTHRLPHAWLLRPLPSPEAQRDSHLDLARRVQQLPRALQQYAAHVLAGREDREIAALEGRTPGAITHRLARWRQQQEAI